MNFIHLPARILGEKMLSLPRLMLMACLICPSFAWALGLGEIHLNSALNEPLNAEIDLIAAAPDELTALRATLAGRDAFTRYGIDRPPFLTSITFTVGKGKDGHDALLVRSTDAIPEPFVTFLVEVNWSRGRLMREYTVLLDPPVYTPGEGSGTAAPVTAAASSAPPQAAPQPPARKQAAPAPAAPAATAPAPISAAVSGASSYSVKSGDTLSKVARSLNTPPANLDQTMIALYRANPDAFGGNINILRRGAILRVPGGDQVTALNQTQAMDEVHRQMNTWRETSGAAPANGRLRLVTPGAGGGTSGTGTPSTANAKTGSGSNASPAETQALQDRVKDLESQLTDSRRLLDVRNAELAALQRRLGVAATPAAPATPAPTPAPSAATPPPSAATPPPSAATPAPSATTPPPSSAAPPPAAQPSTPPESAAAPAPSKPAVTPPPAATGSWIDWVENNWWVPLVVIIVLIAGLAIAARRRRDAGPSGDLGRMEATDVAESRDPTAKLAALRRGDDPYVVEESGEHQRPEFGAAAPERTGEATSDLKAADDTLSSESAVNLDQGDPLAEADFHMAYGLYDQAADLVRIALEREPDRRDLRLKLLEIYFVWGNKDLFLQTAKSLEATRDRAPAGEWDKIIIMGRQICPDDPLFAASAGAGRGAGALVDLNLEGGENRVDIDLFGDAEGERSSLDHSQVKEGEDTAATGESPSPHSSTDLDFTLDAPERGADESPTRQMPPRDEPTVESELMNFTMDPTAESPIVKPDDVSKRIASKLGPSKADQTAEVSIDDLGLDLEGLEQTRTGEVPQLGETTDHPSDAPTMVAGLDDRSRRMMAEAESRSRDRDLTELERELEASFIADLDSAQDDIKTAVLGPESAPTVMMPKEEFDTAATSRFKAGEFSDVFEPEKPDIDSTSKLRGISEEKLSADSIDLDLDRLATALGGNDTLEQPRAAEDVFSTEVFESSQRGHSGGEMDLDLGEELNSSDGDGADATNRLQTAATARTAKLKQVDSPPADLEPVTMSEVGTKLDLARAYMDMGDPEGARSILEEVVQEGSASQKQEAQRLIETLPG
jgi:pilus assembly protein FimV